MSPKLELNGCSEAAEYPPVKTQSCSKNMVDAQLSTTQKKAKYAFSNSVVTKSTATKPSIGNQVSAVKNQSHRKSSDYYIGGGSSSWKNQSLVSMTPGGLKLVASSVQTPCKQDQQSSGRVGAGTVALCRTRGFISNSTGIGKKRQQKSSATAVYIGGVKRPQSHQKSHTVKARKNCHRTQQTTQGSKSRKAVNKSSPFNLATDE